MTDKKKIEPAYDKLINKERVSRRNFLFLSGTAAAASFLPVFSAQAASKNVSSAPAGNGGSFLEISQFVTDKPLSPHLAKRAWWALEKHDSDFPAKFKALRDFITAYHLKNINKLKDDAAFTGGIRQTAMDIVSAYYLGYVGTPKSLRAHDDTLFVSYTHAVMHQFHYEYVPIPTYSRWDEGYWAAPTPRTH